MKQEIRYCIQFYSPWHCGSGTSAGSYADELVVKDKNKMPFAPGRTLKGLIREAASQYLLFSGKEADVIIKTLFGEASGNIGSLYFTNANLNQKEYDTIVSCQGQDLLYEKLTTTAIDTDGIAKEHSLHSIEVVVPCTLYFSIIICDATFEENSEMSQSIELIDQSLGLVKRIGLKRNRGLGRCDIKKLCL